ncbi:hypothetical protein G9A89_021738 [Geosiphon pyriformis]|nr:hypothetical protein G9A89_021738 [Geosiphon pyriformis]
MSNASKGEMTIASNPIYGDSMNRAICAGFAEMFLRLLYSGKLLFISFAIDVWRLPRAAVTLLLRFFVPPLSSVGADEDFVDKNIQEEFELVRVASLKRTTSFAKWRLKTVIIFDTLNNGMTVASNPRVKNTTSCFMNETALKAYFTYTFKREITDKGYMV